MVFIVSRVLRSRCPSSPSVISCDRCWAFIAWGWRVSCAMTDAWKSWSSWCYPAARCTLWSPALSSFYYSDSPYAGVEIFCRSAYFAILFIPTFVCASSSCCQRHIGTGPHYKNQSPATVSRSFLAETSFISSAATCLLFPWRSWPGIWICWKFCPFFKFHVPIRWEY